MTQLEGRHVLYVYLVLAQLYLGYILFYSQIYKIQQKLITEKCARKNYHAFTAACLNRMEISVKF